MTDTIERTDTVEITEAIENTPGTFRKVTRAALALAHITAKEESRPVLNLIHIENNQARAAAGFMCATVELPEGEPGIASIPRDDAMRALRKTTPAKTGAFLELKGKDGTIATEARPKEHLNFETQQDYTFPCFDQIVPGTVPQAATVMNLDMLESIVAFFKAGTCHKRGDTVPVEVRLRGVAQPIEFRARTPEHEEMHAVLMPMVMGHTTTDSWFFDPVEDAAPHQLLDHHVKERMTSGQMKWLAPTEDLDAMDKIAALHETMEKMGYSEPSINAALNVLEMGEGIEAEMKETADV